MTEQTKETILQQAIVVNIQIDTPGIGTQAKAWSLPSYQS